MKHLIISLTILFISSNLFGQETGVLYLYKTSSGLVWETIGDDKIQAKYNGAIKNGEPEGIGNLTSPDGDKFDGVWKDGKKHGQGEFIWSNGNKYAGEWNVGLIHGQGTYIYSNGNKYTGKWKDGKKHGQGTYNYTS